MTPKFVLKKAGEEFHFVLKARNGETILQSETYVSKQGAINGIASIKENAPIAILEDLTQEKV